jgi:hypothetical protein
MGKLKKNGHTNEQIIIWSMVFEGGHLFTLILHSAGPENYFILL